MNDKYFDYIICGGGASGILLLRALRQDSYFEDQTILIIDKELKSGNDRTWCYWEKPIGEFDSILTQKWGRAQFSSETHTSEFDLNPFQYKMLRSGIIYDKFHKQVKNLKKTKFLLAEIKDITSRKTYTEVITSLGSFKSKRVFNSLFDLKSLLNQNKYPVLKQHFLGWFIKTKKPVFDPKKIIFMDFNIPQENETRFIYLLPQNSHEALVEYTLFSKNILRIEEYENGIKSYLESKGIVDFIIEEKEKGSIPMTCFPFYKLNTRSLLHIGTAGGWTKPSTGFTFMNTRRKIDSLLSFLKTKKPLDVFSFKNRFLFYDLLFIDVLTKYNDQGSNLFARMFQKNHPVDVLRFIDEKSNFLKELKIFISFSFKQQIWFLNAIRRRIF
ncbi:MAG: lycopene cyclase family protein [Flavobacteriaceae bacterium]